MFSMSRFLMHSVSVKMIIFYANKTNILSLKSLRVDWHKDWPWPLFYLHIRKFPTQNMVWKNDLKNHQNEEINTSISRAASKQFNDCSFIFFNKWEKGFLMIIMLYDAKLSATSLFGVLAYSHMLFIKYVVLVPSNYVFPSNKWSHLNKKFTNRNLQYLHALWVM